VSWSQTLLAGRWRLGPRLGEGGQGRTYLARDEKADGPGERLVAVKELRLGDAGWKKFDLFEREARVLAKLQHPAIPKYLDRVEGEGGKFYLVMERAAGETLKDLAARRRFDERELRDVLAQGLDVLEYLHGREPPVIHRDIKPANLLRGPDGRITLVDFGGVRDVLRDEAGSTMIGTFGYMAPEQLHGEATHKTDLYGLGATLVALAGGVEPEKVPRKGLRMDLSRHLPKLAGDLRELLQRMIDPDPDRRPESAAEARASLGKVVPYRPPEPEAEPEAPSEGPDWVREIDELSLPGPVKVLLRVAFGIVGLAGHLGLLIVAMILVPLGFAAARAVSGREGDEKLRAAERRVQAVLGDTRRDFRALQRRAFRPAPRLPPAPQAPRLPGRKRR
jgi:serine/threonine protein kinase